MALALPLAGADDFTPVLIYVTIKAAPEALASNLAFIERYRMASRLVAESSYFFVQMVRRARARTHARRALLGPLACCSHRITARFSLLVRA